MDDNTAKRLAESDYQKAKQAYKQARKAAGKSNKGKVIGIILLILISFLAGAFVMWTVGEDVIPFENPFAQPKVTQQATSQSSESVSSEAESSSAAAASSAASENAASYSSASTESASSDSASAASESSESSTSASVSSSLAASSTTNSSSSSASTSSQQSSESSAATTHVTTPATGTAAQYVGTWKGTLTETANLSSSSKRCYGATERPLELVIDSIEATGRVKAHAKVLIHNHDLSKLDRDIDRDISDKVVEFDDLTATYENGSIEFVADTSDGITVVISVEKGAGSNDGLSATVTCGFAKDVFTLEKD